MSQTRPYRSLLSGFWQSRADARASHRQAFVARAEAEAHVAQCTKEAVLLDDMMERDSRMREQRVAELQAQEQELHVRREEINVQRERMKLELEEEQLRARVGMIKAGNHLGAAMMEHLTDKEVAMRLIAMEERRLHVQSSASQLEHERQRLNERAQRLEKAEAYLSEKKSINEAAALFLLETRHKFEATANIHQTSVEQMKKAQQLNLPEEDEEALLQQIHEIAHDALSQIMTNGHS